MAAIGFGLNTNEDAAKTGFDQYSIPWDEALGAVAEETWTYNPVSSGIRLTELYNNRNEETDEPLIPRDILNEKYTQEGLFFEEDEKQSTVDILLERKKEEQSRKDIISRGPEGSWNPFNSGFYYGAAKLGTSLAVSLVDPINLASAFIPVVGQARFAWLAGRTSLRTARVLRGVGEGAVGAALVEPLVYGAATYEQADYTLRDSFLNITFGSILGGGLHVGAGALRDFRTRSKYNKKIEEGRKIAEIDDEIEGELNLYKEYYPENGAFMKALEDADPETHRLLLQKALGDMLDEQPVNVKEVADLDPRLAEAQAFESTINELNSTTSTSTLNKLIELRDNYKPVTELESKLARLQGRLKRIDPSKKEYKKIQNKINRLTDKINAKKTVIEEAQAKNKILTNESSGRTVRVNPAETELKNFEESVQSKDINDRDYDIDIENVSSQVNELRARQKDLDIDDVVNEIDEATGSVKNIVDTTTKELDDFNTNKKTIKDKIIDAINCVNGK